MLVCFSAASNVTGIVTDTDAVAEIAHTYGALVGFDYAGGGKCHLDIKCVITIWSSIIVFHSSDA